MSQYNIVKTDILIIGAGLAGLNAAYEAALLGSEVTVICKGSASASPEVMGFNAPIHPDDSPELFYEEIMKSGQMLNRSGLRIGWRMNPWSRFTEWKSLVCRLQKIRMAHTTV